MYKVLHLITSLDQGGAEAILARFVRTSFFNSTSVVVSIRSPGIVAKELISCGIDVYSLDLSSNPLSLLTGIARWFKLVLILKPDIVHSWLYHANLLSAATTFFFSYKQVWGVHNSNLFQSQRINSTFFISRLLGGVAYFQSPTIIYCAKSARDYHINYLGYPSSAPSSIVVNGVADSRQFHTRLLREPYLSSPSSSLSIVFGCIARYHKVKNHSLLLASFALALKHNPNIKLVLVGEGLDLANLRLNFLITTLGLADHVSCLGHRTDINDLILSFDFHILASRSEAFPSVLIESMILGTPCISTDVGDSRSIIGNCGWISPSHSSDDLANCILSAADLDYQRRLILMKASYRRASTLFSLSKMSEKYDCLYRELLAK